MFNKKSYSARMEVSIITFIILLLQILIFYIIFSNIDVLKMLENSVYDYYENKLEQSVNKLEQKMINNFSAKKSLSPLLKAVDSAYERSVINKTELELNTKIAEALLESMNNAHVTGAFVLLNDDLSKESIEEDEIFFIRDKNSDFIVRDNSDIVVKIGSTKYGNSLGLAYDSTWRPRIKSSKSMGKDIEKIKNQIIDSYQQSGMNTTKQLSFWISGVDLADDYNDDLVYVEPIIDKYNHKLYGILGVEVSKETIADILDIDNFSAEFETGFALLKGVNSLDDQQQAVSDVNIKAHVISYFGDYISGINENNSIKLTVIKNKYKNKDNENASEYIYELGKKSKQDYTFYGLPQRLRLYNKDSFYSGENWQLILFVNENNFRHHEQKYYKSLGVSVFISMCLAIILSFVLSNILTKPVRELVGKIENIDVNKALKFEKTHIREMDLLTEKIEELSRNIGSFYFKMQNILELIGFGLVIIEEDKENDMIYRTGRLSVLFGEADESEPSINEYEKSKFEEVFKQRTKGFKLTYLDTELEADFKIVKVEKTATGEVIYVSNEEKIINDKHFHIYSDYTDTYKDILAIEREKNYDSLTDLINRDYFKRLVNESLDKYPDQNFVMIMWDLDNLKYINDSFGHDWGDLYLKETARVISVLRGEDAFVSRFSGDEFFAFLRFDGDKQKVRERISKIHNQLLNSELQIGSYEKVKIRASVGVCWYPEDGSSYEELYKFADFAMYRAKHTSKGSIIEFERKIYDREYVLISGKEEFNRLIENSLVRFAFQPIVSSATAEIFAYEALMRPISKKIQSVDEVMKIAKMQFKLPLVEKLTFETVFSTIDQKREQIGNKKIFINSIANVVLPLDCESDIRENLRMWGEQLVIEITESEEIDKTSMDTKKLYCKQFSNMLAIDDFGSGYSTEKTLLRINPDFIKIDMSIVRDIDKDKNRYQLVKNIIDYAQNINIKTIAEGIETEAEMRVLMELGVDLLQGYYLAKPNFEILDIGQDKKDKILSIRKGLDKV